MVYGCMKRNGVESTCGGTKFDFKIKDDKKYLKSKSDTLYNFHIKIWQHENFSNWNLTPRKFNNSKSDALYFFISKPNALYFFNSNRETL